MDGFVKRLNELVKERQMSAVQLARETDVNPMTIRRYLNPDIYPTECRYPRVDIFVRLCDVFGVSMDYLWGRSDQR